MTLRHPVLFSQIPLFSQNPLFPRNRALYSLKRALCFLRKFLYKRAIYPLKRSVYSLKGAIYSQYILCNIFFWESIRSNIFCALLREYNIYIYVYIYIYIYILIYIRIKRLFCSFERVYGSFYILCPSTTGRGWQRRARVNQLKKALYTLKSAQYFL